jgi:hypothetical protein
MNSPYSPDMKEVEYRTLRQIQQQECPWCRKDATQEAVLTRYNLTAIIRCCDDRQCMWRSADMCLRTVAA